MKDNTPQVSNYFKDERIQIALRNIVVNLGREIKIPQHYYNDLIKLINEDGITEGYLDFLLENYEIAETSDDIDSIDFEHNPFYHGWDC